MLRLQGPKFATLYLFGAQQDDRFFVSLGHRAESGCEVIYVTCLAIQNTAAKLTPSAVVIQPIIRQVHVVISL